MIDINTQAIAELLPERRWFGDKGRPIRDVEVIDSCVLEEATSSLVLALIEVRFEDGSRALYNLPLLSDPDGTLREAFDEIDRLKILGDLMAHGRSVPGDKGVFHFAGPGLDPLAPPGHSSISAIGAEQSNTSLVFDETVILKLFRRVEPGINPDIELTRLLTNEGFGHVPAHVGEIIYTLEREDDEPLEIALGLAQHFFVGAREGWDTALERLRTLLEDPPGPDEDLDAEGITSFEELGATTARLHVLLSREEQDPEAATNPLETVDLKDMAEGIRAAIDDLTAAGVTQLAELRPSIEQRLDRLASIEDPGLRTRIHGDYHLGQVLVANGIWLILDFEGEPARPLSERRAPNSPLKDVAGMLRSFGYAASAVLFEKAEPGSTEWNALEPTAQRWKNEARDHFINGYLRTSHEGDFLPKDRDDLHALLEGFEIEKAVYEVGYELRNRPDWLPIPLVELKRTLNREEHP